MCTGLEIAAAAAAAASIGGSIMGGKNSKKAGKATGEAVWTEALGHARQIRKAAREVRSTAQAAYAGAGVDVSEGTPLIADQYIVRESEQDALNTILQGRLGRRAARQGGSATATGQYLQGAGTLLSAYGQMSQWARPSGGGAQPNASPSRYGLVPNSAMA